MTKHNNYTEEDEIDLRELFATILRYKKSIFFITLIGTLIAIVIAYRMPKYYSSSARIEIKTSGGSGISLGGANALLGLGSMSSGGDIEKDLVLLKSYKINSIVIPKINYQARYFTQNHFKNIELTEDNCSISVTDINLTSYQDNGKKIVFEDIDDNYYKLSIPGRLSDKLLGKYKYGTSIKTDSFTLTIYKNTDGAVPSKIILAKDKHYIYEQIKKNLTITKDKNSPFVSIKYFDTIPSRGESYIKELLNNYINFSVNDKLADLDITLGAIDKQMVELEKKVETSNKKLLSFQKNKNIISPIDQAKILTRTITNSDAEIIKSNYAKVSILKIEKFVKNHKDIDAVTPALQELRDTFTIRLISKLQSLQLQESKLSQEFKDIYPALKSIRIQIKKVKNKIIANINNLRKTIINKNRSLKKLNKKYRKELADIPLVSQKFTDIKRDYSLNQKLYSYLLQKRSTTELKKAETISKIKIYEDVYTSPNPVKPKKALIVIVSFITLIILSIFIAFFREFLKSGREERVEKVEEES